ncbi:MAG: hypothetical protein HY056_08125 [Proteobacteria bacterium]|nr:hypothetical protein [Pseudomonadota bacterium]
MKMRILAAAMLLAATGAYAADAPRPAYKAPPPPPPAASAWDIAFGAAVLSDYNFRGISQTNRKPGVNAYFEPRYNINPDLQLYSGIGGYSLEFPNNAAAEIDIYGGIRPTFGKLGLDFGVWYYWYPGGRLFPGATAPVGPNPFCTNLLVTPAGGCNAIKSNLSFVEFYAKATYTLNDNFAFGGAVYYAPDWLNTGADATYLSGNAKYTGAAFANGIGWYSSGELAYYWLGRTDAFYGLTQLPDYLTWNVGFGLTYKVFSLDFRYYDTDLSKANCNVLTGDHTATFNAANITALNPSGLGSKWCNAAFIVSFKADLTLNTNIR